MVSHSRTEPPGLCPEQLFTFSGSTACKLDQVASTHRDLKHWRYPWIIPWGFRQRCISCRIWAISAVHPVDALDVIGHVWAMEMSTCLDYYDSPRGPADAIRLNARLCFWSPSHYIWNNPFQWIPDSLVYHNYPLPCVIAIQTKWSLWLKMAETANTACAKENDRDLSVDSFMYDWAAFFISHAPSSLLQKFAELAVFICAGQISLILCIINRSLPWTQLNAKDSVSTLLRKNLGTVPWI